MKKLLIKLFLPSAEDIATLATRTVVEFINTSGKEEVIAKYGTMADNFTCRPANGGAVPNYWLSVPARHRGRD